MKVGEIEDRLEQAENGIQSILDKLTRNGKTVDNKDQARWERWRKSKVRDFKDGALVAVLPEEYCNEFRPLGTVLGRLSLKGIHSFGQLGQLEQIHPDITKNLSRTQQNFLDTLVAMASSKLEQ